MAIFPPINIFVKKDNIYVLLSENMQNGLHNGFLIEVLKKNSDLPDSYFLDKLASNYTGVYSVEVETIFQEDKEKRQILFKDVDQLKRRIKSTVDVFANILHFKVSYLR